MGLSIGLDTAVSGLRAAQTMIDVAAHNVANANTEGFSRQEVAFRAVRPVRLAVEGPGNVLGQLGLGVDSGRIRRLRDGLLDVQYRNLRAQRDQFETSAGALRQVEATLAEPTDEGLHVQLARFFNAFRDVTTSPESVAARMATVEQGATLASTFNRVAQLLQTQRADLDLGVQTRTDEINSIATELADLNKGVRIATVAGNESNDLKDRRDLLLDRLAGLAGATAVPGPDGVVDVYLGTRKLVDGNIANAVTKLPNAGNANLRDVEWASDSAPVTVAGGELKGVLEARDTHVPGLIANLDTLVSTLATAVNTLHAAGYGLDNSTGLAFFTGTTAATLGVNATLRASPRSLAVASNPNEPGNPDTARAIAALQDQPLMLGGTATLDDAYRQMVAALGVTTRQAEASAANSDTLVQHIDAARQSVSGVSVDDEMATIIKGEHAYGAAARIISTVDQMLDTLINRT